MTRFVYNDIVKLLYDLSTYDIKRKSTPFCKFYKKKKKLHLV